jgi:hypothetical protein
MSSLQHPSTTTQSRVVQFDMQGSQRHPVRQRATNEFKTITDALTWVDQYQDPALAKQQLESERWKTNNSTMFKDPAELRAEQRKQHFRVDGYITETRDKFRTFVPEAAKEEVVELNQDLEEQSLEQTQNETEGEPKQKKQVKIFQDDVQELQSNHHSSHYTRKSSVKSKSIKSKKAKLTPAQSKHEKEMHKRQSQFNNTTRWLADSAFTTYFGKPAFHPYGRANTNPTVGGINYGQNMLTHINAECGDNPPHFQQVYDTALNKGIEKTHGLRVPELPHFKDIEVVDEKEIANLMARFPIMPAQRRPLTTKKGQKKPNPPIQIAKAEMTLTGFEHSSKVLRKKTRLENRANKAAKRSDAGEQQSRKSSMKVSN